MALKRWILSSMNRMNAIVGRSDLPPRLRGTASPVAGNPPQPSSRAPAKGRDAGPGPEHLGAYAPLVSAIGDELAHFVSTQLRLHLAIAERDRYLLTSIEVECVDGGDGAELLRRFRQEFTPEQIKRFLARDVIAHLPNASSIDLSQFGGLNVARSHGDVEDAGDYADLVAQLRATTPSGGPRAFDVALMGRWTDAEPAAVPRDAHAMATVAPSGMRLELAIEDADGTRDASLAGIATNRRYAIGKGEGCDIRVKGAFASRRHCEIWHDGSLWWVADAGSTNGVRVESASGVLGRAGSSPGASSKAPIEVKPGASIVLSALAQGTPADYPRIVLRQAVAAHAPATPLAPAPRRTSTPVTPIAGPIAEAGRAVPSLSVSMATGTRSVPLGGRPLPVRIGRSRQQDVVVDWTHEGVSGHHVDIAGVDARGADVIVHGDNGVTVAGVTHRAGDRFRWSLGQPMTLGRAAGDEPECTLLLVAAP